MKFLTCTAIENRIEGPIPSQINMQIHTEHQIMLVPNTWYILSFNRKLQSMLKIKQKKKKKKKIQSEEAR